MQVCTLMPLYRKEEARGGRSNLHRQSTAEILLEAAGELGGANNGTASGKKDADGKNANV